MIFVLRVGGEDNNTSHNVMECYNPRTDQWHFAPSMKQRRAGCGVAVSDGKLYVAGTELDLLTF